MISLAISSNPGSDQAYAAEDVIEVTVSFSETVEVTGTPQLRLRVGSSNRTAGYLRGTDTEELVFGYEVADGREDTDGVSIEAGRITLNGGTISGRQGRLHRARGALRAGPGGTGAPRERQYAGVGRGEPALVLGGGGRVRAGQRAAVPGSPVRASQGTE